MFQFCDTLVALNLYVNFRGKKKEGLLKINLFLEKKQHLSWLPSMYILSVTLTPTLSVKSLAGLPYFHESLEGTSI